MAQPANTYATNDMVGIREDLQDVIYDISPVETPAMSMFPFSEATNTLHEWQTDALAAATSTNAVIEGDDATTDASVPTVRLGNYTQISDKVARVTRTAREVNTAGRADELDYQMLKRARELRRDMETTILANKAKDAGTDTRARQLAGIGAWIATNDDFGTGGASPVGDGTNARTDGTQRAFAEANLKSVLVSCWDAGGEPDVIMTGGFNRQVASSFGANNTNFQKAEDPILRTSFDVYESDFGQLKIVPNRFCRPRDGLVLQSDMWGVAFIPNSNMAVTELAKTGDSDRRQILSEYTLVSRNEKASGGVFDLTTS